MKVRLIQAIKIISTKKEFILYNLNDDKITDFSLCNDLRNRKQYQYFRVVSTLEITNFVNIN